MGRDGKHTKIKVTGVEPENDKKKNIFLSRPIINIRKMGVNFTQIASSVSLYATEVHLE